MPLDVPALQKARDDFNAALPIETAVIVRQPGAADVVTHIRAAAVLMGSGKVLVWVYALIGGVPIECVSPAPPEAIPQLAPQIVQPPQSRERPWTSAEDVALLAGRAQHRSYLQIANDLGRTRQSCFGRYARLTGKDTESAA